MCGIFGAVALPGRVLVHEGLLPAMAASLHHRGPDGARLLRSSRCALGATRLRIIDPTEQADQPFCSPNGSSWLACNGEIYNSADLRRRYPDFPYRSPRRIPRTRRDVRDRTLGRGQRHADPRA
jgi:asparagine synthetase B (glutamine-hydrolysing)